MPCRAETPAYSAMLIGPLRFFTETSPVATFHSMRMRERGHVPGLAVARPAPRADRAAPACAWLGQLAAPRPAARRCGRRSLALALGLDLDRHDERVSAARRPRARDSRPGCGWTRATSAAKSATGSPSTATISSPARSPAAPPGCRAAPCRPAPARSGTRSRTRGPAAARRARSASRRSPSTRNSSAARASPSLAAQAQLDPDSPFISSSSIASTAPRASACRAARPRRSRRRAQAGARGDRVRRHVADHRLQRRHAGDEQHPVGQRRRTGNWRTGPRAARGCARQTGLRLKAARRCRRVDRALALVEQLDVAAERDGGDHVFGAVGAAAATRAGLPKPIEKRSTWKPRRRATQKWPNSCTATSTPIATRNASNVAQYRHVSATAGPASIASAKSRAQRSASSTVARPSAGTFRCRSSTASMSRGDAEKPEPPVRNAATATSLAALRTAGAVPPAPPPPGPAQGREAPQVRRPRSRGAPPPSNRGIVHRSRCAPASRGPGRSACACRGCRAGPGSSRPRTPPASARCSADGRPPRPGAGHAEQQAGLDQLEALVHQRGRIDRDLAAHAPARVGAGLVRRHAGHALERRAQERPARGGEQDAAHARGPAARLAAPAAGTGRSRCARCRSGSASAPPERAASIKQRRRPSPAIPCWRAARACRRAPPPASTAGRPRRRSPPSRRRTSGLAAQSLERVRARQHLESPSRPHAGAASRRRAPPPATAAPRHAGDAAGTARAGDASLVARRQRHDARSGPGWRPSTSSVLTPMLPVEPSTATPHHAGDSEQVQAEQEAPEPRQSGCRCGRACRRVPAAVRRCPSAPAWRLNMLSVRSPTTETSATSTHSASQGTQPARRTAGRPPAPPAPATSMPAPKPSQVLPGLTRGASLRRPKRAAGEVGADVGGRDQHQQEQQQRLRRAAPA